MKAMNREKTRKSLLSYGQLSNRVRKIKSQLKLIHQGTYNSDF